MKNLLLAALTFASANAFAVKSTSFVQMAKCTYTDEATKRKFATSLLFDELEANSASASGLVVFKSFIKYHGKVAVDYAESTSVDFNGDASVAVNLAEDSIVNLSKDQGNKLIFDRNGKAILKTQNGQFSCQLTFSTAGNQ